MADDVVAALAQYRVTLDFDDGHTGHDLRLGLTQAEQHVPAVIAGHLLGDDALPFEDRDMPGALGDAFGGLDADHAAADHGDV